MRPKSYTKSILAILAIAIAACDLSVGPHDSLVPQQLLFVVYGPHIRQGIYSLESDGQSIKRLTPDSLSVSTHYSCSPDGETILFSAYYNQNSDIWRISRSSKSVTRVISDPSVDESPQWLHEGSGFVFRSNRSGRYSI